MHKNSNLVLYLQPHSSLIPFKIHINQIILYSLPNTKLINYYKKIFAYKYHYTDPFNLTLINLRNFLDSLLGTQYVFIFFIETNEHTLTMGDRMIYKLKNLNIHNLLYQLQERLEIHNIKYESIFTNLISVKYKLWLNVLPTEAQRLKPKVSIIKTPKSLLSTNQKLINNAFPIGSLLNEEIILENGNIIRKKQTQKQTSNQIKPITNITKRFYTNITENNSYELIDKDGNILSEFNDNASGREFKNLTVTKNNVIRSLIKLPRSFKKITVKEVNKKLLENKIHSFDIETYNDVNGMAIPYAIGYSLGLKAKLFYGDDPNKLILDWINHIFKNKTLNNHYFYAHNMGGFDGHFLINILGCNGFILNIIEKDGKILKIKVMKYNMTIHILDSLNLISGSLNKIGLEWGIDVKKGSFPHNFVTKNNLYYIGVNPTNSKILNWDLKKESDKYLTNDIILLKKILNEFADFVVDISNLDITKYVTVASLAYAVYQQSFYEDHMNLKVITGNLEATIRKMFYGGHVSVYENHVKEAYVYDVNSQYPAAMLKDMPVGNPIFTDSSNLDDYFGLVNVIVYAPNIKNGLLPHRNDIGGLIYPVATSWEGSYFSEELKNLIQYGYKFDVINGYTFKKAQLFESYVAKFYKLKKEGTISGSPVKTTYAKLMLNSLYGKFGSAVFDKKIVIDKTNKLLMLENNPKIKVQNFEVLNDKYSMIVYRDISFSRRLVNVTISAAIASYARIDMHKYLVRDDVVYTDTDSVVLKNKLNEGVSLELGDMKLENHISEGIFIAPKLYYLEIENNKEKIKSKGVGKDLDGKNILTRDHYIKLLNGEDITIKKTKFSRKYYNIFIREQEIHIQGLKGNK